MPMRGRSPTGPMIRWLVRQTPAIPKGCTGTGEIIMNTVNHRGRVTRSQGLSESSGASIHNPDPSAEMPIDTLQKPADRRRATHEDDSWWSHAAYGLGAAALSAPLFIPGIPVHGLILTYLALGATVIIALMLWGVVRESRESWLRRKRRS